MKTRICLLSKNHLFISPCNRMHTWSRHNCLIRSHPVWLNSALYARAIMINQFLSLYEAVDIIFIDNDEGGSLMI